MPDFLKISKAKISRRRFLASTAAAGIGTFASPFVIPALSADVLVVNTQGGEYQEIVERTVIKPFEKKFGVKVTNDPTGTAAEDYAKIRASRGAPGFDVAATLTAAEIILGAKENLLEKLSEREVPNIKHLWDKSATLTPPYGVVHTIQFSTVMYNKDKVEKPDSWADYWAPQKRYGDKIKGHVIAFHPNNLLSVYALIFAAQLGGGSTDNMDPAWQLLKDQKPYHGPVVTGSSEAVPYFENGEVWIAPYWSARAGYYVDRGLPFGMIQPKEGVYGTADLAAIPVGGGNKKLAYEFLNFRLDKDVQRDFCLAYFGSPGRGDIADWPKDFAANQIVNPEQMNKLQFPDSETIGKKRRDWTLRWQSVMG